MHDNTPIGYIHYYNVHDDEWESELGAAGGALPDSCAGVDLYIGELEFIGKGIGSKALEQFVNENVFPKFEYAFVDPNPANTGAIKAYSKAGFYEIGKPRDAKDIWMIKASDFMVKLKNTWNLRLLTSDDANETRSFIELFNDFFQLCEGENGSGAEILNACPPSKDRNKDKFVLGLYDNLTLIGLLDIIRDYPEKGIWTIGYFLIHPERRSQGLGSKFIKDLEKALTPTKLRCIVQKQNVRALAFWKSNGFLITDQKKDILGKLATITYVLEK